MRLARFIYIVRNDIEAHLSHKKPEMFIPVFVYIELKNFSLTSK